jgi:tRNA A-37 threonylcarbamoyl transferase component Bud32
MNNDRHDQSAPRPPGGGDTVPMQASGGSLSELADVLEQYLADLQAGRRPDRAGLLAGHPDLGPQLEEALASLEFIHGAEPGADKAPAQLGDFRILREVGRGGMGVVYEAEQISLKRRVALKVLRFGPVVDEVAMQRFQREAETVARLHHTNIVPIFAVGLDQGVRYYAMEFIAGQDLAELAQQARAARQVLRPEDVAKWGLQAADALAHAHERGVIHRDIKPSNIILDAEGRIWLTDFGLARRLDDVTLSLTGALLGTPRYMSPEQAGAASKPLDHRTDIYSLGATLYELATQVPIFDAGSPHELIRLILEAEPIAPRRLVPTLPRDLETIILKCVAKEATQRYASAKSLADDLRAFLEGRAIKARRPSVPEQALRWARKHRRSTTVAAVSALASVMLLVAMAGGWGIYRRSQLGRVLLTTSEPLLQAEVLAPYRDEAVLPSFSLPTRQPVPMPAGSYRVRLSAPDRLSETLQLQVERGARDGFHVALADPTLFPPFPISMADTVVLADLDGSASFVVSRMGEMRRTGGATGQELWKVNLNPENYRNRWRNNHERVAWEQFFQKVNQEEAQLLQPAPDLDGDGVGDLVWSSVNVPALLAISGKGGEVLWWHPGAPPAEATAKDPKESFLAYTGRAIGPSTVLDLDGDGRPDLVTLFASQSRRWIEVVSGATGAAIWRRGLEAGWFRPPSWSNREELLAPQIGRFRGGPFLVVVAGTRFLVLSAETGEPCCSQELPHLVIQNPRIADLNGDGQDDVLLLADRGYRQTSLAAFSVSDRRLLWERPLLAAFEPYLEYPEKLDWPLVADLNHDGRPEIIVPAWSAGRANGDVGQATWTGLEVLSGRDGSRLWRRELARSHSSALVPQINRFLLGPDLDGDGSDEIVVASTCSRIQPDGDTSIYVDALSGSDGHTLWWWRTAVHNWNDRASELLWWPSGPDGWPQLVVSAVLWPKQAGGVYVLEGGSGQLLHQVPNAFHPEVADCNGDGLPDLGLRTTDLPDIRLGAGRQQVIRGTSPTAWARLAQPWPNRAAFVDLDGDGVEDLLQGNPVEALSGATGKRLWRASDESRSFLPLRLPEGDLDGDGVPDLCAVQNTKSVAGNLFVHPVEAWSGRTGRRLWTAELQTQLLGQVHAIECANLDGQAPGKLVVALCLDQDRPPNRPTFTSPPSMRLWLVVLNSRDGSVLWKQPLSEPLTSGDSDWRLPVAEADLDGDGVRDLITGTLTLTNNWELRAFRGTDGQVIWRHPLSPRSDTSEYSLLRAPPEPIAEDLDGDGVPEVLVVDYAAKKKPDPNGARFICTLQALNGRNGTTKWTWTWTEVSDQHRVVPLLVNLRGARQRDICLLTGQLHRSQLVMLDARGTEVDRAAAPTRRWPTQLWPGDLDGDSSEELLFLTNDGRLQVLRGGLKQTLWQQPADNVHSILPATNGEPAVVVVERGHGLLGLAGPTGHALWRCEADSGPQGAATLLRDARPRTLPLVVTAGPGRPDPGREGIGALICRKALPTVPTGQHQAAPGIKRLLPMPARDPRLARSLPWSFVARHDLTGTQRVLGLLFGGWLLGLPVSRLQQLAMLAVLVPLVAAGWWSWRKRSWKVGVLVAAVVVSTLMLGLFPGPLAMTWFRPLFRACSYVTGALPLLIFAIACADAAWSRRWDWLARLMGGAAVLALLLATAWLGLDLPARRSGEYYVGGGWYLVAVAGAGLAGVVVLLTGLGQAAWRGWKRVTKGAVPPAGASGVA